MAKKWKNSEEEQMLDWLIMLKTICRSEEKLKYVLKADGKDFLTNKTFSEKALSWNSKMEFCSKKGLAWKLFG